ncbi:chain-length determining protein [Pseudomonas protegens]|uniref:GNVR domain-containing protein n=1 Tax=Pseudomonas protegens TaxID=380021 RepID=UPI001C6A19FF|nr:GNVR domain-containing protein [Pseudomonas protegens]QYN00071.1 chain-length determining protein [Pseudomonas protegens]
MGEIYLLQASIVVTNISRVPSLAEHEHIDFFAMLRAIWLQRKVVLLSMILMGGVAGAYAFLVTPEYVVGSVLRPVAVGDLDALNRSEIYELPPERALLRVGEALGSYDSRMKFFRANPELFKGFGGLGKTQDQVFDDFNESLRVIQPEIKKASLLSSFITLELRYPKGGRGPDIVNGLVKYTLEQEREHISQSLKVMIANRLSELDTKIASARAVYDINKKSRIASLTEADNLKRFELQDELKALRVQLKMGRESRIAQLDEEIKIARSLGLKRPSTPSAFGDQTGGSGNVVRTEINNQQIPLYFFGSDVLESERNALSARTTDDFSDPRVAQIRKELLLLDTNRKIEMLNKRQDDDLFLEGVEALRAERLRLQGISTNTASLSLVDIDRVAVQPLKSVKPKKALVIAIGLLLGALVGIVLALVRYALAGRPKEIAVLQPVISVQPLDELAPSATQ